MKCNILDFIQKYTGNSKCKPNFNLCILLSTNFSLSQLSSRIEYINYCTKKKRTGAYKICIHKDAGGTFGTLHFGPELKQSLETHYLLQWKMKLWRWCGPKTSETWTFTSTYVGVLTLIQGRVWLGFWDRGNLRKHLSVFWCWCSKWSLQGGMDMIEG